MDKWDEIIKESGVHQDAVNGTKSMFLTLIFAVILLIVVLVVAATTGTGLMVVLALPWAKELVGFEIPAGGAVVFCMNDGTAMVQAATDEHDTVLVDECPTLFHLLFAVKDYTVVKVLYQPVLRVTDNLVQAFNEETARLKEAHRH